MAGYYDTIAEQYKQSKQLPSRLFVDSYTYFTMIGEISGKSILDLGCGEGFYTRQFRQRGAARVVGVDISKRMIELAKQEEAKTPLEIEYIVDDVLKLGKIGTFDLVVASYLLNHARTKEQLLKMCQTISANLKPNGRFVAINNNAEQPPESYAICAKYGFTKSISGRLQEGATITVTYTVQGEKFSLYDYYLSRSTYEWAFQSVGFTEIRWQKPLASPEGVKKFSKVFWEDFLEYSPIVGIECIR